MAISCWRCCSFFFQIVFDWKADAKNTWNIRNQKSTRNMYKKHRFDFGYKEKKIRHCSCKEHRKYYIKAVKCYSLSSSFFLSLCVCLTSHSSRPPIPLKRQELMEAWPIFGIFDLCYVFTQSEHLSRPSTDICIYYVCHSYENYLFVSVSVSVSFRKYKKKLCKIMMSLEMCHTESILIKER